MENMADKRSFGMMGPLTPIPVEDIHSMNRSLSKMTTAMVRVESAVDTIKDDLLPPVSKAATKAKDGVLKLEGRVKAIEERGYECKEENRFAKQESEITETKEKVKGTARILWWLLGIAAMIVTSAVGFVVMMKGIASENTAKIQSIGSDIGRHERDLVEIRRTQREDRQIYLKEIRDLPVKVQSVVEKRPSFEAIENATDDLPLTQREQLQLIKLLRKAKKRESENLNNDL